MADRRIYTWYYRRYDGKVIYVVAIAKDADTDEDVIIWTLNVYSCQRQAENVDFRRNRMSFFGGQHSSVYSPYTPLHLPA